ncbi:MULTISPECIES: enoyl-CoA hydratase [unclassified Oleiphilus]|uniref:enoyl-CoA hydratase n=2 Tax=Oleiphilus TaxID=141450 RepID=UPI0007C3B824|nr:MULTISPECIES: enoyl-CoA hydratase [unclassified Oleiphilus]KZY42926.1 enoyl-CoA hydratase [Oleiphilus sp. HI0050]KZZ34533.1 enoyl-CoA hydratase [Oleiphilus sp. HI0117]KZZ35608.1 enoyl-CoA hydratase [Oleiphilus sp. HI0086]KZZ54653.1 enoyl-CoA hydratase [Oleiphilus sp. HI0123]
MTQENQNISSSDKIIVTVDGHIAKITINNPPANTWDLESLGALSSVIVKLNAMSGISALVIHGQGEKFFSAGADLKQFSSGDKILSKDVAHRFGEAFEALASFKGVSIAAINGYAMGGGLECALACDIRIVEEQAQVALPEAGVGLLPCAGGTQRLSWLIGEAWASKMILLGQRMDAETAVQTGLALESVPKGEALSSAMNYAQSASKQSPDALFACKKLLSTARENAISLSLQHERTEFINLIGGDNQLEGTNSFLEKRSPEWKK